MTRIYTDAQIKMLRAAQKHGNAFHLVRPEQISAGIATRDALMRRGLLKFGNVYHEITDAGRKVLADLEGKR